MKDDKKTYDEVYRSLREQYSLRDDEDKVKIIAAIRRLAGDGNIHASFHLSTSISLDIPREERDALRDKVIGQYEEEPGEYEPWFLCRIANKYFYDQFNNHCLDLVKERLVWYRRAYAADRLYAARKILQEYRYCQQRSLDGEYRDFCLEILEDADYYIRDDTYVYSDGSKEPLGTVGDAVNGLVELANRGDARAEQMLKKAFESGFFGKK